MLNDLFIAFRDTFDVFLPYIMGLSLAYIVYYLFSHFSFSVRKDAVKGLADYYQPLTEEQETEVKTGSFEHKVRLAALSYGLKVDGKENLFFYGVVAGLSILVLVACTLLNLPPVLILAGSALSYVFIKGIIDARWNKMRIALEKELPVFLLRLSATLQATPNVIEALVDVADTLDPQGPLYVWVKRMISAMQSYGQKGLEDMSQEASSISPSLTMTVLEISRLWETGGLGYIQSFQLAAQSLSNLISARANAQAKSDGAWGTIRVILLALGGAILMAMINPGSSYMFHTPIAQIGLLLLLVWAAVGWNVIGDAIREVSE